MLRYRVVQRSQQLPARLVLIDEYNQRATFDTWSGQVHDPATNPYLEFYSDYGVWFPVADQHWYTLDELKGWQP